MTVAAVTGGVASGAPCLFTDLSIDSRTAGDGDLFIAIQGEKFDGNDFARAALGRAAGALVSRPLPADAVPPDRSVILVPDSLKALRALAWYVLDTLNPRVLTVTGSVGKTTTKEILAAILSRRFETMRTPGNRNNHVGLPFEVARMAEGTQAAVLEMGTSAPGEILSLATLARPEVGMVTAVAPVHLAGLVSLDAIRDAKAEILDGMRAGATFVANAEDARVLEIARRHAGPVLRYALSGDPSSLDASAAGFSEEPGRTRFRLRLRGEEADVLLPLPGRHNALNFLGAAAAASVLGLRARDAAAAAQGLVPARHRGELRETAGILLYDDCYNSSPAALRAAFSAFETAAAGRRKIAVLGEMLELGPASRDLHAALGRELGGRIDLLIAVRGDAAALAEGARAAGTPEVILVADAAEALAVVLERLAAGDAVLVKGSRGVGLDLVASTIAGEGTR